MLDCSGGPRTGMVLSCIMILSMMGGGAFVSSESATAAAGTFTAAGQDSQEPFGESSRNLTSRIQAQDFDTGGEGVAYQDTSAQSQYDTSYRDTAVDISETTDSSGEYNIGHFNEGEWLEYTVDATPGTYDIRLRIATARDSRQLRLMLGNDEIRTADIPNTGGWDEWQTVTVENVEIDESGTEVLRVAPENSGINLNWVEFDRVGQSGQLQTDVRQVRRPAFPNVTVFGSVSDERGESVSGLTEANFTITENGSDQPIQSVERVETESNVSVSLVVDASGSMDDLSADGETRKIEDARTAADQFVAQLNESDEGQIISFSDETTFEQRWTTNASDLAAGIDRIRAGGSTALWNATITGVRTSEPRLGRSAVVVLTDGQNILPPDDVDVAIEAAQDAGVPVYVIGLGPDVDEPTLQRLANESGGSYYRSPNSSDLASIYEQIGESITAEYRITYRTNNNATDGTNRTVRLTTEANGQFGSDTGTYQAPCAPLPMAEYEYTPETPTPGGEVTFDAGASTPNGGTIENYLWDFDNDGVVDATGETVSNTYPDEGTYRARLTVEKSCGAANVTVGTVSVSDDPGIVGDNSPFVVESTTDGVDFNYTFTVDGSVERAAVGEREGEDSDRIVENDNGTVTVSGFTGNLYGDAFTVTGEITSFERTGGQSDYRLEFNGTDVTETLTGSPASTIDRPVVGDGEALVVESTTQGVDFNYTFTVDGSVERAAVGEREGEDSDRIVENDDGTVTVSGFTGNLYGDAFTVTGELTSFERTGGQSDYRLEFNGTDVTENLTGSPASTVDRPVVGDGEALVVESTTQGADFNYTFTVDGSVERIRDDDFDLDGERAAEDSDRIIENGDGTVTVRGFTGNLYGDAFVIQGEIRSFERTGGESDYRLEFNGSDATEALTESDGAAGG